ncbi:MAG: hypothetical protein ACE5EA_00125 [Nitrospirota bacterium]
MEREIESKREDISIISIRDRLVKDGLYSTVSSDNNRWRISTEPFFLSRDEVELLERLGDYCLLFYKASNRLYYESISGKQPEWAAEYLDIGKPDTIVEYGRMKRFRRDIPHIIRPDIILTDDGIIVTELDSVPGGIGITSALSREYDNLRYNIVGDSMGMVKGFADMIRDTADNNRPVLAIVVSDESRDYMPEMKSLGRDLNEEGLITYTIEPKDLHFSEECLYLHDMNKKVPVHLLYRFFELFDLKNIPKSELIMYSAKKRRIKVTPPFKAFLEEKMLFFLFHHPMLREFWMKELGDEAFSCLQGIIPGTWLLDPVDIPPYAVIPDLMIGDRPVNDWRQLFSCTQKERLFVIKPSGFSELAWGSRGVFIGHDISQNEWSDTIDTALRDFSVRPYILQEFHKGKRVRMRYYDFDTHIFRNMQGRVRLSPYYFVIDGKARLSGILATICPDDKKIIHGMADAIMSPCAIKGGNDI